MFNDVNNQKIEIFKHPYYDVFKSFKASQSQLKSKTFIYKIKPCAVKIDKYQKLTNNYKILEEKCKSITENLNGDPLVSNELESVILDKHQNALIENERTIEKLRKKLVETKNNYDINKIITRSNNRQKLQSYNNRKTELLNLGYEKLINNVNKLDINIEFESDAKKRLISIALKILEQLKSKPEEKIETIKKIIGKTDEEVAKELQDVLDDCDDLSEFIDKNNIPCLKCDNFNL